ncbi:MAG: 4Fe-4S dicluster domain-containing protein [Acidobacteria bacterium]|nr:4Fe-4S dicluster domain-containing protein [Acidobacteriota bacterium]
MARVRPKALLIDITRCVGCRECVAACLVAHGLPTDPDTVEKTSSKALTALSEHGDLYVRQLCRHCLEPSCVSVCPVQAFSKTPAGPVVYDASRCLGCRYCMQACPFGVPKYEWDKAVPAVVKCDFCADRQARGEQPACAEACPAEATIFGDRDELIAEAHRRIDEDPDTYHPHVYGESEIGGTSMLFLSPVPFEQLGFQELGDAALPELTARALERIPGIVSIGGALLAGIWWITNRREEVARAEAAERSGARQESSDDRA